MSLNCYSQEKTIDKILDNTKSIFDLMNSKRPIKAAEDKKSEATSTKQAAKDSTTIGKFIAINNTGKRVIITLNLISSEKDFSKQFVLSVGDKEIFKNLGFGTYEYTAKFEDGTIAKSGEIDINIDNKIIEKEIK